MPKEKGIIFEDAQGRWTVQIELPMRDHKRRRKVVRVKTEDEAKRTLRRLLNELDKSGDLQTRVLTFETWINEWFETIALLKIRPKTAASYRSLIKNDIIPVAGRIRLDKLTAADIRRVCTTITNDGRASSTANQAYRIMSVALKYAEREGHVARNVATLVDAPRRATTEASALTLAQAKQVLATAKGTPWESLWYAVLLTGARQGELLGLEVDRVGKFMEVSWQMQRISWEHGCDGKCNRKRGSDCRQRKVTMPADWEHRYVSGGHWLSRPKSNSGRRLIPLVGMLAESIHRHIEDCAYPNPHGLVWRTPKGEPIDQRVHNEAWHALLKASKVPDMRLHDGRHTAVDLLYEAGLPEDLIVEIVGHSMRSMTRNYKSQGHKERLLMAMMQQAEMISPPAGARSEIAS